jgi:hypothetical protein
VSFVPKKISVAPEADLIPIGTKFVALEIRFAHHRKLLFLKIKS